MMDPELMTEEELAARGRVWIVNCQHCGKPTRVDVFELLEAAGLAVVEAKELARFRQAAEDRKRWLLQLHEVRCTDGGCLFRDPLAHIGMQTNGGCKCLHELRPEVRMALTQMLRQVQEERRWEAEQASGEEA